MIQARKDLQDTLLIPPPVSEVIDCQYGYVI